MIKKDHGLVRPIPVKACPNHIEEQPLQVRDMSCTHLSERRRSEDTDVAPQQQGDMIGGKRLMYRHTTSIRATSVRAIFSATRGGKVAIVAGHAGHTA